jgi:hypothetical protein
MYGSDKMFTTSNYELTTCPRDEYNIVIGAKKCSEKDLLDKHGKRVRFIKSLDALAKEKVALQAGLRSDEILTTVRATQQLE